MQKSLTVRWQGYAFGIWGCDNPLALRCYPAPPAFLPVPWLRHWRSRGAGVQWHQRSSRFCGCASPACYRFRCCRRHRRRSSPMIFYCVIWKLKKQINKQTNFFYIARLKKKKTYIIVKKKNRKWKTRLYCVWENVIYKTSRY